jgi:hypothetical protein
MPRVFLRAWWSAKQGRLAPPPVDTECRRLRTRSSTCVAEFDVFFLSEPKWRRFENASRDCKPHDRHEKIAITLRSTHFSKCHAFEFRRDLCSLLKHTDASFEYDKMSRRAPQSDDIARVVGILCECALTPPHQSIPPSSFLNHLHLPQALAPPRPQWHPQPSQSPPAKTLR